MKTLIKRINWCVIIKYIIIFLSFMYVLVAFGSKLQKWYDTNAMPFIKQFKSNIFVNLLVFILLILLGTDMFRKYQRRYQYDNKVTFAMLIVTVLLVVCRVSGDYDYVIFVSCVSYADVIVVSLIIYFLASILNKARLYYFLYSKDKHSTCSSDTVLNDWPIKSKDDDIFDFGGEVEKLSDKIKNLDRKKVWSLAITAPWGTGKTSFLNMIEEQVNDKEFEIMHFTPRDSKSYKLIQEDFFTALACVLSKYDSRCGYIIKDYMASLQLIDNRKIIEKLVKLHRIWDKENLKISIEKSFEFLDKRVLVLIDDFDRLSKEEIFEVLKLIDSNAAFKNLIFLTAYDKNQVSKTLGESYQSKDACFVDKYFNIEYSIPARAYSYISHFIENQLRKLLKTTEDELRAIQSVIVNYPSIFEEYLPTLRDAKRFINQLIIDYQDVRGDVILDEFIMVELIKYRYPVLYKSTFKKEYVVCGNYLSNNNDILYLKKGLDSKLVISPVLNILFSDHNATDTSSYHHIYDRQSFNNYFVSRIYGSLRINEMRLVLSQSLEEAEKTLNDWLQDNHKTSDFIDYLNSLDMNPPKDGYSYIIYADILAFLASKLPDSRAYSLFLRVIYLPNLKGFDNKFNQDIYKNRLIDIITNSDSQLTLVAKMHVLFITKELDDSVQLIQDSDIWPFVKKNFIRVVNEKKIDDMWLLTRLRQCIIKMDENRKVILDGDCLHAYRKRIEELPTFYIKNFVFLGAYSSHPDYNNIACEPFWKQIFIDETRFEAFLINCKFNNIEKVNLVWNYWQLYKANNFKPLVYENQGPVQEKINNGLAQEIIKMERMKKIEKAIDLIPDNIKSLSDKQKSANKTLLIGYKKSLENIDLYITLHGKILDVIDSKLQIYSD